MADAKLHRFDRSSLVINDVPHCNDCGRPAGTPGCRDTPAAAAATSTVTSVVYLIPPLPAGTAFSLTNAVPTIFIAPASLAHCILAEEEAMVTGPAASPVLQYCNQYHGRFATLVQFFIQQRASGQVSENSQLPRDAALLHIIGAIIGPSTKVCFNVQSASVTPASRLDGWLARSDEPPLVLLEQKATNSQLHGAGGAISDLTKKFQWMPHYNTNQFVFGIATAGDLIYFGRFTKSGALMPLSGNIECSTLEGAISCLHAALNIGRACRDDPAPAGLRHPYGVAIDRPHSNSRIYIFARHVFKKYFGLDVTQRERLKSFYTATAGVPHLEQRDPNGITEDAAASSLEFKLTPVGVAMEPSPPELRGFLRDVLTALGHVADRGWAIVDVRMDNVVRDANGRWVVIDAAEHATQHGKELPTINLAPHLVHTNADRYTDVSQLLASILARPGLAAAIQGTADGQAFWQRLSDKRTSAKQLLQLKYLK